MQIARRQIMRLAAGATAFPIVSFVAIAEDFPSRPITWVVPFPAGGPVDTVARIMTDPMSRLLQQPIVIENVSGAAGSIGAGRVARAPPDGYMLIHGIWSTHVVNGAVYRLSYDVFDDFAPIAHLTDASQIVVARKCAIKAYAVTSKTRMPAAAEIPTVDEAGLPTFHTSVWTAVLAPKNTPAPVIGKINTAIVESLADPALRARIEQIGPTVVAREEQTPEALGAFHK